VDVSKYDRYSKSRRHLLGMAAFENKGEEKGKIPGRSSRVGFSGRGEGDASILDRNHSHGKKRVGPHVGVRSRLCGDDLFQVLLHGGNMIRHFLPPNHVRDKPFQGSSSGKGGWFGSPPCPSDDLVCAQLEITIKHADEYFFLLG
jgi:hypothetical protein